MTTQGSQRFPHLEMRNLGGGVLVLHDELPGPRDLLVLAFRRRQPDEVDRWRATVDAAGLTDLGFWEVPVIARAWGPVRGRIDGAMASAIADPDIRRHTITPYTDVRGVCRALGIAGTDRVVAVLVANGAVHWQHAGAAGREPVAALVATIVGPGSPR